MGQDLVANRKLDTMANPCTAFVSGHLDLTTAQFESHYQPALDDALARGDMFILSDSRGADTMTLRYLLHKDIHPARITIFLASRGGEARRGRGPRGKRGGRGEGITRFSQDRISSIDGSQSNRSCSEPTDDPRVARFQSQGVSVRSGWSSHTARDEAMTKNSDYDIAWVRSEAETRALYGHLPHWRDGRISGTEKNLIRRREQRPNPVISEKTKSRRESQKIDQSAESKPCPVENQLKQSDLSATTQGTMQKSSRKTAQKKEAKLGNGAPKERPKPPGAEYV